MVKAIKLNDADNVASVFDTVQAGSTVQVLDKRGNSFEVVVNQDVPYGHKFAIAPIAVGQQVTKYGEEIGIASCSIAVGDYVHVHNVESIRGRGDWAKAAEHGAGKEGEA
ncbi:MAG: UxaA family hydrolase [Sphaerochaetaceae bacterium]|jgi:altronate dehydratase small subunit